MKIRFIALAAVLLVMAGLCFVYVALAGATYTQTFEFEGFDDYTGFRVTAKSQDENILRVDKIRYGSNGSAYIDYVSVNPGRTVVTIDLNLLTADGKEEELAYNVPYNFLVTSSGIIFELDNFNFDGAKFVQTLIIVGMGLVSTVTLITFIENVIRARFSYAMVANGGVALFTAVTVVFTIDNMKWIYSFRSFLSSLLDSGYDFASFTTPLVGLIAVLIAVSNIWLLRHEGYRPQNMLGIALAVVLLLGFFLLHLNTFLMDVDWEIYIVAFHIKNSVAIVASFFECMLLSVIVSAFLASRCKPPHNKDYLIILGCCIRPDGTPTPILRGRVDAAIRFERAQYAATGKHAKFVPSGGQGADEVISESESMKRYLMEQGYPEEQIILEDKSVNTDQNIRFSRDRIIDDAGSLDGVKAGFATTNYHIFRGYILSGKHKLDAQGISAKTKWYFFPNAFLREFAGLLFDKKWFIAISVILLLVFYTIGVQFIDFVEL